MTKSELESLVALRNKHIIHIDKSLSMYKEAYQASQAIILEKDAHIESLQSDLNSANAEVHKLQQELSDALHSLYNVIKKM